MKPGRELDGLVAEIMGYDRCPGEDIDHFVDADNVVFLCKPYSTDWAAAGEAWEWLEQNYRQAKDTGLALGQSANNKPAVLILGKMESPNWPHIRSEIEGETYPHAIALAVVELARIREQGQ